MTDIHFYHLTRSDIEQVLPELLEKTIARGWRAVVMTGSAERAEVLNQQLWSFRADSFLPHGSAKDGHAELQPVWLTAIDERPNNAEVLFLTDGVSSAHCADYMRVCEVFSGNDEAAVALARARWKEYLTVGHTLNYWQQGERGWEKKATT